MTTGLQSNIPYRLTLLPPIALERVGEVLTAGKQRYGALPDGRENWEAISVTDHIDHALFHINRLQLKDINEDHLAHAACRLLFALNLSERPRLGSPFDERTRT